MATVPSSDVIDPDMAGYLLVAACYLDYSCRTFRLRINMVAKARTNENPHPQGC